METETTKTPVRVASCMPLQNKDRASKLAWLEAALDTTDCDLFLTPQEYLGGHYMMPNDLHMERGWVLDTIGNLATKYRKCIGIGACSKDPGAGATEDYFYFDSRGECLGRHSKFALPAYDDVRAGGHGDLWPETSFSRRAKPIEIPELRIKVGTIFCWEVFSQALWGAYSFEGVNLIAHPIKFAPRGWLNNKKLADGKLHIQGFGNAPKSQIWYDRLIMASRHQCLCPIAVSCNSWNLGSKFSAMVGWVDEVRRTTELLDIPSEEGTEFIHTQDFLPEYYDGLDHHHSAGAFKAHVGSVEGFSEMGEWTMHGKIRRLEAQLIGGTTLLDCVLKTTTQKRQKPSSTNRALGTIPQRIPRKKLK